MKKYPSSVIAIIALGALSPRIHAEELPQEAVRGTGLSSADVKLVDGDPATGDLLLVTDEWWEECGDLVISNLRKAGARDARVIRGD